MTYTWLDGNALAGPLRELLTVDLTAATGTCDHCGAVAHLAEARVHARAPGLVARCSSCESVLLRLVRSETRAWLDARGLRSLEFDLPA